jgi:hypothetical protein
MDPIFPHPGQTTPVSLPAPVPISMAPVSAIPVLWQHSLRPPAAIYRPAGKAVYCNQLRNKLCHPGLCREGNRA